MPNNLPRLEKAIKRIIWEQKHKAPNESQNYVQWLHKIDVFFTCLTAIASVGPCLGSHSITVLIIQRTKRPASWLGSTQLYSYLR